MAWRQMVEGNNESDRQRELQGQLRQMNPLEAQNLGPALDYLFGVAPRTAIRSMQEGNFNPAGQLGKDVWNQMRKPYKEASATAPTGEDIVGRAGVTNPTAKKILGFGMEVAADPALPLWAAGKLAMPLAGQIKKLGTKGEQKALDELDAIINKYREPTVSGELTPPENFWTPERLKEQEIYEIASSRDFDESQVQNIYDDLENLDIEDIRGLRAKLKDVDHPDDAMDIIYDYTMKQLPQRDEVAQIAKQTIDPAPAPKRYNEMTPEEFVRDEYASQQPAKSLDDIIDANKSSYDESTFEEIYGGGYGWKGALSELLPTEQGPLLKEAQELVRKHNDPLFPTSEEVMKADYRDFRKKLEDTWSEKRYLVDVIRNHGAAGPVDEIRRGLSPRLFSKPELERILKKSQERFRKVDTILERLGEAYPSGEWVDSSIAGKRQWVPDEGGYNLYNTGAIYRRQEMENLTDAQIDSLYNKMKDFKSPNEDLDTVFNEFDNKKVYDEWFKDLAREKDIQKELERIKEFEAKPRVDETPIQITGKPAGSLDAIFNKYEKLNPATIVDNLKYAKLLEDPAFETKIHRELENLKMDLSPENFAQLEEDLLSLARTDEKVEEILKYYGDRKNLKEDGTITGYEFKDDPDEFDPVGLLKGPPKNYTSKSRKKNPLATGGALHTAKQMAQNVLKRGGILNYSLREHGNLYRQLKPEHQEVYDFLMDLARQYGDTSGVDMDSIYRFIEDGMDERNLTDHLRRDLKQYGPVY